MRINFLNLDFKKLLFFGFFWALSVNASDSSQKCITTDWYTSLDSHLTPMQDAHPVPFATVNGHSILFDRVPGSEKYINGVLVESQSKGCFSRDLLLVGTNRFSIAFHYKNNTHLYGQVITTFTLEKGKPNQRILCQAQQGDGSQNGYSCEVSIDLSLSEVDPEYGNNIQRLRDQARALEKELHTLEDLQGSTENLQRYLNQLTVQDLENLTTEQILAISAELTDVAQWVSDLKADLETLRIETNAQLTRLRDYVENVHQTVLNDLLNQGIDPSNLEIPETYHVKDLALPSIDLPSVAAGPEDFNVARNLYTDLAQKTKRRLEEAVSDKRWTEASVIIETWSKTVGVLGHVLQNRVNTSYVKELRTFNQSVETIRATIDTYFDDFGFNKKAKIPPDIKKTIIQDIAPHEKQRAEKLRDALNGWDTSELNQQQKLIIETIRGIGLGFKVLNEMHDQVEETRQDLRKILDQAIEITKSVSRVGFSFTPYGKFIDLCEVITAKEFCIPSGKDLTVDERVFSAIGFTLGSGEFWRKIAEAVASSGTRKVGVLSSKILDSARRLGFKTKPSIDRYAQFSKQILRADEHGIQMLDKIVETAKKIKPRLGDKFVRELPAEFKFRDAFETVVRRGIYEPGDLVFQAQRKGQKMPGNWFSPIKPINAEHAEELFYINKYGNDAGQVKAYIFKERVSGYAGKVKDGAGYQFYIPEGVDLIEILEEVIF